MNLLLYYTHGREYDVPKINEGLFSIVLIFFNNPEPSSNSFPS